MDEEYIAYLLARTTSADRVVAEQAQAVLAKHFDPTELRDDHGRWSLVGAAEHAVEAAVPAKPAPRMTVRSSLRKAKTFYEVQEAFEAEAARIREKEGLPPVRADMRNMDVQTAREHAEGVLRCLERFPRVNLTWVSRYGGIADDGSYAHAHGSTIRFNEKAWANPENRQRYLRVLRNDVAAGWHPAGTGTPAGVAIHEFGHILDASAGPTKYGHEGTLATDGPVREALLAAKQGRKMKNSEVAKSVSEYSASSIAELMAEAFADVMVNGDGASPLSKSLFKVLEDRYNRWLT